jgi:galactokinase
VTGTDAGLRADLEPGGEELVLETVLSDGTRHGPESISMDPAALDAAARGGGFFSYAAGVAAEVVTRHEVQGLRLTIRADLPVGKGLSSSAASCVLVARAFDRAHGLGLSTRDEMELAYAGERRTGSECGRMDQICAWGRRPTLVHFDGPDLEVEPLVPGGSIPVLVVDLCRAKDTRRILRDLNRCFPHTPGPVASGVRDALGARNLELVGRARAAIEAGDASRLGELMTEAQAVFDAKIAPACPEELRAPRLHEVLAHPAALELAFGGKGVGSQGDGCAQLVARGGAERDALAARLSAELGVACFSVTLARIEDAESGSSPPLPSRFS